MNENLENGWYYFYEGSNAFLRYIKDGKAFLAMNCGETGALLGSYPKLHPLPKPPAEKKMSEKPTLYFVYKEDTDDDCYNSFRSFATEAEVLKYIEENDCDDVIFQVIKGVRMQVVRTVTTTLKE